VLAEKKFSTAVEMTKGDGRLEAEARQSHAINKANRQMDENEYESAVETLDTAISEIIQLDVDAEYTTHLTRVLSAKQAEFKGIIAQSNNNIQAAIDAFEDANELLDELGFDRSYRRVTGRLNQLEKQQSRKTKKSVETATNTTQSDENTFDKSAKKPTTKSNNNQNPTTEKIDNELQTRNQPKAEPETANDDNVEAIDPTLIDPTDDQPEGMHRHGESRLIDESVGDRKQE
jgi:hypothetical protein